MECTELHCIITDALSHPLAHSFTRSLTRSLSLPHSLTPRSVTHPLLHSPSLTTSYLITRSHSLAHSLSLSRPHSLPHSLTHSCASTHKWTRKGRTIIRFRTEVWTRRRCWDDAVGRCGLGWGAKGSCVGAGRSRAPRDEFTDVMIKKGCERLDS